LEKLKVKDIMTVNPIMVNQQATVQEAVSLMLKHRIDGLPVVDDQETLVGIFTKTHALKALGLDTKVPVAEIMQRSVITISDEASPEEAWQIPVGRLVVVNSVDQMVGIITRTDLVTAFQRKLEYALEEFIGIINSTHNSIIAVDRNGRIVLMNKAAEKMTGIAVSEVLGKDIDSIIANSGLSEVIQGSSCQLDPKVCIRDKAILANRTPIIKNGIIIGAVGVYQEISELESLASEFKTVKRINEELNTVIEYSADGFIVADEAGNIIKANQASCNILGIPDSNIIGKHVNWLIEKGYNTESVIMKVLKSKKKESLAKKINNGKEVLSTGTPIFDENGNIYHVVSNLRDLTELNRVSFELNKAMLELEQYRMENLSDNIIYRSSEMVINVEKAIKVAKFDSTVMLLGESGVGKEVLAKIIYSSSKRSKGPFVKINCAAIPYNLFESELFGYEGGTFTGGSKEGRLGLLELANNGTAFLDEIGEMPLDMQVKLLRVLQEREILRVGGRKQIKLDIRIIAATNRNLEEMVKKGRFRDDLYWRLNVVSIQIPPLRKRREDITALIYHFLQNFNRKYNTNKTITASVITRMVEYNWPGNIRELENTIERMLVLSTGNTIDLDFSLWFDSDQNKIEKWATLNYWEVMNETEKRLITQVYNDCKSTRKAAKILGIDQSTIVKKLKKYKPLFDDQTHQ